MVGLNVVSCAQEVGHFLLGPTKTYVCMKNEYVCMNINACIYVCACTHNEDQIHTAMCMSEYYVCT